MVKQEVQHGPSLIFSEPLPFADCITSLLNFSIANNMALAAWRLPQTGIIHVVMANQVQRQSRNVAIETLPSGYLVAPFQPEQDRFFLPADYHFTFINEVLATDSPETEASGIWLHQQVQQYRQRKADQAPLYYTTEVIDGSSDNFREVVRQGIQQIENGTLEKIVPSRTKQVSLPPGFNISQTYLNLCRRYPHAMVSMLSTPETGTWLGATPEVLVSIENQQIFRTVALAGTQGFHEGVQLKHVAWTQKEIEEQALVERYIISCFKKIRVREYEEHGPKTFVAGNLMHLKSDFTVDMKAINFPQLGSVMLQLLHPTSAVCGMPLEPALHFLKKHETHNRELYAGYLGPVNIDGTTALFVNLRCTQLQSTKATLYAGAGVTADSLPDSEWNETEMKMNTLYDLLRE